MEAEKKYKVALSEKIFIRKHRGPVDGGFPWIVSWDEPCYDNESEQYYSDARHDAFITLEEAFMYAENCIDGEE